MLYFVSCYILVHNNWTTLDFTHKIRWLMEERRNYISNALELHLSCTKPMKWLHVACLWVRVCIYNRVALLVYNSWLSVPIYSRYFFVHIPTIQGICNILLVIFISKVHCVHKRSQPLRMHNEGKVSCVGSEHRAIFYLYFHCVLYIT